MAWLSLYDAKAGDWVEFPDPKYGSGTYTFSTNVDGGRNALGNFIGNTVGTDKMKFECSWGVLNRQQFQTLAAVYDKDRYGAFIHTARLLDPRTGTIKQFQMYVGDRSGTPIMNGELWLDVQANLIEV